MGPLILSDFKVTTHYWYTRKEQPGQTKVLDKLKEDFVKIL